MTTLEQTATDTFIDIFNAQKAQSLEFRKEPVANRVRRLKALKSWIMANRKAIQEALYQDLRKSPDESDIAEIYVSMSEVRKAIRNVRYWAMGDPAPGTLLFLGADCRLAYEPKGTVLIISPWNYPFSLAVGPLISAIAAGNTVIMKPSEISSHTSSLLARMVSEVFKPEEATVIEGGVEVSSALLSLPFDHIFFTGSPRVGKIVMEAASKHLTSVTLELGGKSPCIVDKSAHVAKAARRIAWGKWINAGQTCVAPDTLWVHADVKEKFIAQLKTEASKLYGNPDEYTCIINQVHYDRLNAWLSESVDAGANVIFGGKADPSIRRIEPTLVEAGPDDSPLASHEIFGPILFLKTFSDIQEVTGCINSRPKPLALYLFATSNKTIETVNKQTSSGSLVINDCDVQFGHPTLPFGGVNNSGIGKSHGRHGFVACSNEKPIIKQPARFAMSETLYPPYTKLRKLTFEFMIRFL
jgi:aldehyde dehydrogenase (NAD+)